MTPFWRRERPLHERLAEEGGLTVPLELGRDVAPWHQAGVHGLARPRQWDAVVTAEADVPGDSVSFVALEDGTLLVEENVPDEESPVIVKSKQFAVKPMSPEEAVLQLELIGHDFFVFQNGDTDDVNVVYRRRDGNYGLIEPQVV